MRSFILPFCVHCSYIDTYHLGKVFPLISLHTCSENSWRQGQKEMAHVWFVIIAAVSMNYWSIPGKVAIFIRKWMTAYLLAGVSSICQCGEVCYLCDCSVEEIEATLSCILKEDSNSESCIELATACEQAICTGKYRSTYFCLCDSWFSKYRFSIFRLLCWYRWFSKYSWFW